SCMSMFQWKQEYSVDHSEIDSQHQSLFQLADALHSAMTTGKGKDVLNKTLLDLIAYTKRHFASEERLMQQYHYPEYGQHKAQHDELAARVIEFQKNFVAGKIAITIELLHFLKDWLAHHIAQSDHKIGVFLKNKAA